MMDFSSLGATKGPKAAKASGVAKQNASGGNTINQLAGGAPGGFGGAGLGASNGMGGAGGANQGGFAQSILGQGKGLIG